MAHHSRLIGHGCILTHWSGKRFLFMDIASVMRVGGLGVWESSHHTSPRTYSAYTYPHPLPISNPLAETHESPGWRKWSIWLRSMPGWRARITQLRIFGIHGSPGWSTLRLVCAFWIFLRVSMVRLRLFLRCALTFGWALIESIWAINKKELRGLERHQRFWNSTATLRNAQHLKIDIF